MNLAGGMKTLYEFSNSDVHSNAATARAITLGIPTGPENTRREFVTIVNDLPLRPVDLMVIVY